MLIVYYIYHSVTSVTNSIGVYTRKDDVMLFVYIVAVLASVLFALSLQSVRAGVLGFLIVLVSCDIAVFHSHQGKYVGPVAVVEFTVDVMSVLLDEVAVAEKKAAAYEACVKNLNDKVWNPNQVIPSHRWIHDYCSQQ